MNTPLPLNPDCVHEWPDEHEDIWAYPVCIKCGGEADWCPGEFIDAPEPIEEE